MARDDGHEHEILRLESLIAEIERQIATQHLGGGVETADSGTLATSGAKKARRVESGACEKILLSSRGQATIFYRPLISAAPKPLLSEMVRTYAEARTATRCGPRSRWPAGWI